VGTDTEINDTDTSIQLVRDGTAKLILGRDDSSVSAGNNLGNIQFFGNAGGTYQMCASIAAKAAAAHADDDKPTSLVFSTTADGESSVTEWMRIDSSGRLLIGGTSAVNTNTSANLQLIHADGPQFIFGRNDTTTTTNEDIGLIRFYGNDSDGNYDECARIAVEAESAHTSTSKPTYMRFFTTATNAESPTEAMRIDSSGNLLVGLTAAAGEGQISADLNSTEVGRGYINLSRDDTAAADHILFGKNGSIAASMGTDTTNTLVFKTGTTEAMRIDSSGRVGINTDNPKSLLEINSADGTISGISLGSGATATTSRYIGICNAIDNTNLATNSGFSGIEFGGPSSADEGYLAFHTHDLGGSSAERMRIDKSGHTWINSSDFATLYPGEGNTETGFFVESDGKVTISRDNTNSLVVNRNTSDGIIIDIRQAGIQEGTISVSGSTVSYNGGHLSRWSQLPGGVERTEILRGSVLSNLDEMCEWGEEDNEQLNRMKVSDVEGDKNVSGIFQSWDDDDDTYINDFYCAMTGDFVIRIAQGTTVARGDLLMSAGDGTAKPQDDDIVRSKTIAKVTSTNVSETYGDGSYCVPCVLMAC
jgi:hypothetical protein